MCVCVCMQGIINCEGTETFAKKPKLAKLLPELKPTPVSYNKKVHWFLSHVPVMANLLHFGCFSAG